eukprot:400736-Prymnesium_polylepis.3
MSAIEGVNLKEVKPLPPGISAGGPSSPTKATGVVIDNPAQFSALLDSIEQGSTSERRSRRPSHAERAGALAGLLEKDQQPGTELELAPAGVKQTIQLKDVLLMMASTGTSVSVSDLYNQMTLLAGKASRTGRERLLMQLPSNDGSEEAKAPKVDACWHVAIDLPGHGRSHQVEWNNPADVLADVFRSLGKTHAYALVGSEQCAAAQHTNTHNRACVPSHRRLVVP